MADTKMIALAGIPQGGNTTDGQRVWFRLDTLDNTSFRFDCPHEAIGEIVENLLIFADAAKKARGEIDQPFKPYGIHTTRAMAMNSFTAGFTKDGKKIILSMQCGPVVKRDLSMTPEQCKSMADELADVHAKWRAVFLDRQGRAN